jgi:hypothetical protein
VKFKSPSDTPVYVALLSGHCATVGPEWRELPFNLHRRALEEGCITDNMDEESIAALTQSAVPQPDRHQLLVGTIKAMMDDPQPGEFTGAGLPNLKVLCKKAGWNVSREEMMQAVHAIGAEEDDVITID